MFFSDSKFNDNPCLFCNIDSGLYPIANLTDDIVCCVDCYFDYSPQIDLL